MKDASPSVRKKDIAIIGMSGKFPKAETIALLWEHLVQGNELVTHFTDDALRELGVPEEMIANERYVRSNAFVDDPEYFDYRFFGYTKDEAEIMDPQTRIMHQQIWLALENAGYCPDAYEGKIGLYLSASDNLNWRAQTLLNPNPLVSPFMAARLSDKNFISTLISYNLNLKGPSYFSSTACSSSLTAIHMACRNLLMRECNLALAGAASIITTKQYGYLYEEDMIFSNDGHSRVFDAASTGTIFGEGVGVVVLKRLEEAIRDKDHIYAIIRGTAVNNDGSGKVGYTAPGIAGQTACIKSAHQFADVTPESIHFVEAHGTGTKLGDPIEIEALNKAFNYRTDHRCLIGSIKSNLGHLDTVAGVAGVIKTALALHHQMLPPSINYTSPNPEINFEEGPFQVNDQLLPLQPAKDTPLRAGVSSFGIGGTNAHAVLEAWPTPDDVSDTDGQQLLVFSAKTKASLISYRDKIKLYLKENQPKKLGNMAYTLQTGRTHFNYRGTVAADNWEEAIRELDQITFNDIGKRTTPQTVFMFSGGGSQYYQMAIHLYRCEPVFKEMMDKGFQVLTQKTGKDFKSILGYSDTDDAAIQQINEIENMLPVLFLVEWALAQLIMKNGIKPDYLIGHSLGEYVAAALSGVFSFEDAIHLVLKRGELTASLPEGAMLGVEMAADKVASYLNEEQVAIGIINMEDSCVVSGPVKAIENLSEVFENENIGYSKLKISIAAHSPMLDSILDDYEQALNKIQFGTPKIPFISNLSGKEITDEEATSPAYWVKHLRNTVNFSGGLSYLLNRGEANYIEIGSGGILTSFLKQHPLYDQTAHFGINLLKHPKEAYNDHQFYLKALGKLWQHGEKIVWNDLQDNTNRLKVPLPGYVFDPLVLPVKVDPLARIKQEGMDFDLQSGSTEVSTYFTNWKKSIVPTSVHTDTKNIICLFVSDGSTEMEAFQQALSTEVNVIGVQLASEYKESDTTFSVHPQTPDHFEALFLRLAKDQIKIDQVVYGVSCPSSEQVLDPSIPMMHLCQQLVINQSENLKKFTLITQKMAAIGDVEVLAYSLLNATCGMILKDNTQAQCHLIDLDDFENLQAYSPQMIKDITSHESTSQVAYRRHERWVRFYEKAPLAHHTTADNFKDTGCYVLINGLEQYAAPFVNVAAKHIPQLVVTGSYTSEELTKTLHSSMIDQLKKINPQISYYSCDTHHLQTFEKTLDAIEVERGKINGVIFLLEERDFDDLSDLAHLMALQNQMFLPITHAYTVLKKKAPEFVWTPLRLSAEVNKLTAHIYSHVYAQCLFKEDLNCPTRWVTINYDDLQTQEMPGEAVWDHFQKAYEARLSNLILSKQNPNRLDQPIEKETQNAPDTDDLLSSEAMQENYVAPELPVEKELCDIWASLLGYERIGIADNFFELGGNSLKAVTLLRRIQQKHQVRITLKDFYAKPTVRLLSQEIAIASLLKKTPNTKIESNVLKI